ncbi:MAG: hypothetical protein AAGA66_17845, partial [Bacteroidota bacterium]
MVKIVFLLSSIVSSSFNVSSGNPPIAPQEIQIIFSEEPVAFESGQPVYPSTTNVMVKVPIERTLLISVDGGKEMKEFSKEVDITKYLGGRIGTHNVLVKTVGEG